MSLIRQLGGVALAFSLEFMFSERGAFSGGYFLTLFGLLLAYLPVGFFSGSLAAEKSDANAGVVFAFGFGFVISLLFALDA
jgi:ABC-type Mn2+/Zn2+ transport system permease subunit